ncbi:MAG: amidinotransferase [Acidimicrobiales bacterium]
MCPPVHFSVDYRINPWMHPGAGVSSTRVMAQWYDIYDAHRANGHAVVTLQPAEGAPDMVFCANAGLVIDGRVLMARFRHWQRRREESLFRAGFERLGWNEIAQATFINEGEGDYLPAGAVILGASGFRTDRRAHDEVAEYFDRPVIPLELVDPRFYHLDTALAVLGPDLVAYWPGAFSRRSVGVLADLYPDAVIATERDAEAFGLNACSDGASVVMATGADHLEVELRGRGFTVTTVHTSELQKAGGSVKCSTLELRC